MTQLVCPLCGRHLSLAKYDPSGYDDDVYGVEVTGLGRGRGFAVSERYSLLSDEAVMDVIKARCRRILWFAEGVEPPHPEAMAKLQRINKDWAAWGADAERLLREKDIEINRLGSMYNTVVKRNNGVLGEQSALVARNEELEGKNRQWQVAYQELKANVAHKDKQIQGYKLQNQQLKGKVDMYMYASDDDDSAAAAEMEALLTRVNNSCDSDYDNLSDAVDWLLEG